MIEGMPEAPPNNAAMPDQGQASGIGGATMPVPNAGVHMRTIAALAGHVQQLQGLLSQLPVGGDLARDLRDAINKIAKHVSQGDLSPGVQLSEAQRMLLQQRQMGPQIAAMRAGQPNAMPVVPGGQPQPQ